MGDFSIIIHGKTGKCNICGEKVRKKETKRFVERAKVYKLTRPLGEKDKNRAQIVLRPVLIDGKNLAGNGLVGKGNLRDAVKVPQGHR